MIFRFSILLSLMSIILALPLKEADIVEFLEARYAGDDTTVFAMMSEEFEYFHTPYIGLGLIVNYDDGNLVVEGFVQDSLRDDFQIGDLIHEVNGRRVSKMGMLIHGHEGALQQMIITKKGDSTFTEKNVPLIRIQVSENHDEFLNSIASYGAIWHDYHLEIEEIVAAKHKFSILYHWEGSKKLDGPVYHFTAMEFIYVDKKTDLIHRVEGVWSEKQFRDQFK